MKIKFYYSVFIICFCLVTHSQTNTSKIVQADIDSLINKIEYYKEKYDYSNALDCILKLKTHYIKTENYNGILYCNIKQAEVNRHAKLLEKANEYLIIADKTIKSNKSLINDTILIYFYNRKAALATEYFHNPDSTLYYSNKALKLAKEINNEKIELISLLEIGYVFENKNDLEKAINIYKQTLQKAITYNDTSVKNDAIINVARTLTKKNNFDEALKVCEEGLAQLNDSQYFLKLVLYSNISDIYEKQGNIKKAYENLKIRMDLTEKYYLQSEINKLQELNEKYNLKEKNSEIQTTKERLGQVKRNQILLSLLLAIVITGLLVLIYYSKKLKNSKNKLKHLFTENEFLLNEANHRINNNLQLIVILISDELKKLNGNEKLGVTKILSKVESIATLHRQLYKKNHKHEIEISNYLNEIKINFSEILEENHINVTFNVDNLKVDIDHGMYIGLLVTELLINSIKHAFKDQVEGEIVLNLKINSNGYYFEFKDNGKTYNQKIAKPILIDKMCKQLRVEYTILNRNGYHFSFNKNY